MQSQSLSVRVYNKIYEAMLSKRLRPGDHLNRRQVALELGVSVAPVLEAMTQLEWEGFLETSPRRGTVVKPVTVQQSLGQFRLRQAIEVEAARVYAGGPIRRQKEAFLEIARRLDATTPASLVNWRLEVEFHQRLVEAANCSVLSEAFRRVMQHALYHAAHRLLPVLPCRPAGIHTRLIQALAKATPETAEKLIRLHIAPWITALEHAAVPRGPTNA